MAFESKDEAAERHNAQRQQGKQKSPVGRFKNMEWDKDGLKEEVNSFGDGTLVNWSELARRYGVKNKTGQLAQNGGQIAMEWLKSESKLKEKILSGEMNVGELIVPRKVNGS